MVPTGESERAVVVGAGTMGAGIAQALARAGYAVELVDTDPARLRAALGAIGGGAAGHASLESAARRPDVIVEAVPERAELKRRVLAGAERLQPGLLATNTSSLALAQLATALREPARLVGMHFFNPVAKMELVEVVAGDATADDARRAAVALAERLGKVPVVVRDAPGFATTRLGVLLGLEAIRMVEQGVASPEDIDRAMELGYRHPVGPLRLTDLVGLDVRLDIALALRREYGERFEPPALLRELVAQGRLGRKSGRGFYRWDRG